MLKEENTFFALCTSNALTHLCMRQNLWKSAGNSLPLSGCRGIAARRLGALGIGGFFPCPMPHAQKLHPKSGWSFLSCVNLE
ncbi:hypothetical protein NIES2100_25430 [Calothrix sp. NIES-2100]|nr:hypothetical protein NIES2100_25430 [Calothrix sp. NIES-2100]